MGFRRAAFSCPGVGIFEGFLPGLSPAVSRPSPLGFGVGMVRTSKSELSVASWICLVVRAAGAQVWTHCLTAMVRRRLTLSKWKGSCRYVCLWQTIWRFISGRDGISLDQAF